MNIYLEIFGYIGSALVLLSMMMRSVIKLRIINLLGAVINLIFSALCHNWPFVFLNVGLATINIYHLIRLWKGKE